MLNNIEKTVSMGAGCIKNTESESLGLKRAGGGLVY
jgi:hypothetical protein